MKVYVLLARGRRAMAVEGVYDSKQKVEYIVTRLTQLAKQDGTTITFEYEEVEIE